MNKVSVSTTVKGFSFSFLFSIVLFSFPFLFSPGSSVGNLVTFWHVGTWDRISITGIFPQFDFTVDEGKERLNPSREKNKGAHCRRKLDEKSWVTPAGPSNEFDVQNKWEENTHTQLLAGNVCLWSGCCLLLCSPLTFFPPRLGDAQKV